MEGANLGYLTLIPVISFFVLAFATKRCIVSILVSGFLSYVLFYGIDFFYPFLCVIMVPLVIIGVIPKLGGMKKAYERVKETGKLWPDSSDILNEETKINVTDREETTKEIEPKLWAFLIPMLVVVVVTILLDDILYGVTIGILTCLVLFVPTKILSFGEFCDSCFRGLEDMVFIAVVLVTSLFYRESINLIGLPEFLIDVASPYMSATWLPAVSFVLIGLVCFATGNIWSVPALCAPIILPLAVGTGANIPLTLGAIISAACFGAQACFYSDVTLMSASACRINNVDYATAQLPYIFIVSAISFVAYVVAGFLM